MSRASYRRYQVVNFVPENDDDKFVFGLMRWSGDGDAVAWLGEYSSAEDATEAARQYMEFDND